MGGDCLASGAEVKVETVVSRRITAGTRFAAVGNVCCLSITAAAEKSKKKQRENGETRKEKNEKKQNGETSPKERRAETGKFGVGAAGDF